MRHASFIAAIVLFGAVPAVAKDTFFDGFFAASRFDNDLGEYVTTFDGSNGFAMDGLGQFDRLGFSVGGAGDFNGDGFDDLVIGDPFADPGDLTDAGAAYVVFGAAAGFPAELDLGALDGTSGFVLRGAAGDRIGASVGGAGDLNGDGLDELAVSGSQTVHIVFGSTAPLPPLLAAASIDAAQGMTIVGSGLAASSVGPAGDVNGDAVDDLVIGDFGSHSSFGIPARSYVVFGSTGSLGGAIDVAALDGDNGFALGNSGASLDTSQVASGAGDVNGDGLADLIIGQQFAGALGGGESYVVFGTDGGFPALVDVQGLDGASGFTLRGAVGDEIDRVGWSVDGAGDVNGDGVDDLVIGAPGFNYTFSSFDFPGKAFVVFGSTGAHAPSFDLGQLDGTNGFFVHGDCGFFFPFDGSCISDDAAGTSVSGLGDFNGDGYDDILVGAPGYDFSAEAYVVFGSADSFPARIDVGSTDGAFGGYMGLLNGANGFAFEDPEAPRFGDLAVGAAGDVNGDGISDLIIGHPDVGDGGRVYVLFGVPEPASAALTIVAVAALRTLRGAPTCRRR